jgi:hypothetical protein
MGGQVEQGGVCSPSGGIDSAGDRDSDECVVGRVRDGKVTGTASGS